MTYLTVIEWWQTYYFHFNVCQNHVSFTRIWFCIRYLYPVFDVLHVYKWPKAITIQWFFNSLDFIIFTTKTFSECDPCVHVQCASLWFTSKVNGIYYLLNAIHKTLLGLFDHYFVWHKPDFSTKTNFTELSYFKIKYHICLSRKCHHQ